jgi:transposase
LSARRCPAGCPRLEEDEVEGVIVGVDSHRDTHEACVLTLVGARLASAGFAASAAGYGELIAWAEGFGRIVLVGVEGSGSYGAGLTRELRRRGMSVVEVNRSDEPKRRRAGKSDPIDAELAARCVLAGRHAGAAKGRDGIVEAIRALRVAKTGAVKAHSAALNQLHALVDTAPEELRDRLRGLGPVALVETCARFRVIGRALADPRVATKLALRSVAGRCQTLARERDRLDRELASLVKQAAPGLLALVGVGPDHASQFLVTAGDNPERLGCEAAFAALCGAAPVPASSGVTNRHRLSRGGDRQANRALYLIAICRLRHCAKTRAYAARRTQEGLSKKDIIRCLKRYIAREVYAALRANELIASAGAPITIDCGARP